MESAHSYMTQPEIDALNQSDLPRDTPFMIQGVSYGMFSIARHYGGMKYNGAYYRYIPQTDELIRDDVAKWLQKYRKKKPQASTQLALGMPE